MISPCHASSWRLKRSAGATHHLPSLRVDEPQEAEEVTELSEESSKETCAEPEFPQVDNSELYGAESTDKDRLIAMYTLLDQMAKLRKYIKKTWAVYRKGQNSLISVTAITNVAIELVRFWENEFMLEFPESPVWDELINMLFPEIVEHWQKELEALFEQDVEQFDSIYFLVTDVLQGSSDAY